MSALAPIICPLGEIPVLDVLTNIWGCKIQSVLARNTSTTPVVYIAARPTSSSPNAPMSSDKFFTKTISILHTTQQPQQALTQLHAPALPVTQAVLGVPATQTLDIVVPSATATLPAPPVSITSLIPSTLIASLGNLSASIVPTIAQLPAAQMPSQMPSQTIAGNLNFSIDLSFSSDIITENIVNLVPTVDLEPSTPTLLSVVMPSMTMMDVTAPIANMSFQIDSTVLFVPAITAEDMVLPSTGVAVVVGQVISIALPNTDSMVSSAVDYSIDASTGSIGPIQTRVSANLLLSGAITTHADLVPSSNLASTSLVLGDTHLQASASSPAIIASISVASVFVAGALVAILLTFRRRRNRRVQRSTKSEQLTLQEAFNKLLTQQAGTNKYYETVSRTSSISGASTPDPRLNASIEQNLPSEIGSDESSAQSSRRGSYSLTYSSPRRESVSPLLKETLTSRMREKSLGGEYNVRYSFPYPK